MHVCSGFHLLAFPQWIMIYGIFSYPYWPFLRFLGTVFVQVFFLFQRIVFLMIKTCMSFVWFICPSVVFSPFLMGCSHSCCSVIRVFCIFWLQFFFVRNMYHEYFSEPKDGLFIFLMVHFEEVFNLDKVQIDHFYMWWLALFCSI